MSALVTVVTPTIGRPTLARASRSIQAQSFRRWKHLIVPDGPEVQLPEDIGHPVGFSRVQVVRLGHHHGDVGHWGRLLGGLLATTPYLATLDDDNWWLPNHLELLVGALEEHPEAGFAYGQFQWCGQMLGDGNPRTGQIDSSAFVYRSELLRTVANWNPLSYEDRYAVDGGMVEAWRRAGVGWVFVPELTMIYEKKSAGALT